MPKSSSIYARAEPELKEQAKRALSELGIPAANAVNLFLRQIVLHNGIPFDVKLSGNKTLDYSALSREQFDAEIKKGLASLSEGDVLFEPATAEERTDRILGAVDTLSFMPFR